MYLTKQRTLPPDYRVSSRRFLGLSGESQLKRVIHKIILLAITRNNVEQVFCPNFNFMVSGIRTLMGNKVW